MDQVPRYRGLTIGRSTDESGGFYGRIASVIILTDSERP